MTRALAYFLIPLSGLAVILFLLQNVLPATEGVVVDQFSYVTRVNLRVLSDIKDGQREIEKWSQEGVAIREVKKKSRMVLSFADSVNGWFDRAFIYQRNQDSIDTYLNKVVGALNQPGLYDGDFQAAKSKVIEKLAGVQRTGDSQLLKLVIEQSRFEVLDLMDEYMRSLNKMVGATDFAFSEWPPTPEATWRRGRIMFNPPFTMEVGELNRLQVRISRDLKADILKSISSSGNPVGDSLMTSDVMIIRLVGDDFDIVGYDDEEQGVTDEGYTQWEFDVTPRSSGRHTLLVKAGIVYAVPGLGPTKKFLPVYEREVEIKVNTWKVISGFASQRWEFLLSSILFPAIGWGFSRFRKTREKSA